MRSGRSPALRGGAAALILLCAGAARAADWRIGGFFSQRFSVTDNFDLNADGGDGATFGAVTDLGLAFTGQSGQNRYVFAPGVRALGFVGGGADGDNTIQPRFNGSYAWAGRRDDVSAALTVIPESVTDTGFDEGSGARNETFVLRINGSLGYGRRIDPLNRIGLNLFARTEEYLESTDTLEPNRAFGGGVSWSRTLDPTRSASLSTGITHFTSSGQNGENGLSGDVRLGYQETVSERLGWNASLGISVVRSGGDVEPGLVGGIGARYRTADTVLSVDLTQDIDQDVDGRIETRQSLRGGVQRQINSRDSIGVSAVFGVQNALFSSGGDDRQIVSVTPAFSRRITKDWSVSAGYAFRFQNEDDTAYSNTFFVTISRGLSLLP